MKKSLIMLAAMAAMGESAGAGWSRRSVDKEAFGHERHAMGTQMFVDKQLAMSEAQAVTVSAVSTNTIDLSQNRDVAASDINIVVTVDTTVTAAGAATVTFQAISSAAAALTSPTVLAQSDAIGKAELTAGRRPIVLRISRSVLAAQPIGQRYLGLNYVVTTGPLTAGAFTAHMTLDVQDVGKNYPSGFSIA